MFISSFFRVMHWYYTGTVYGVFLFLKMTGSEAAKIINDPHTKSWQSIEAGG